jgi:hypothetical protein
MLATISPFPEVAYVSTDRQTKQLGHLSLITGANQIRQGLANNVGRRTVLDGAGIGIAVLDSGIFKSHKSFHCERNEEHGRLPILRSQQNH